MKIIKAIMAMSMLGDNTFSQNLMPIVDCNKCAWDKFPHPDAHCYMFKDSPRDNRCGQFKSAKEMAS